jgi:hypothetical protein
VSGRGFSKREKAQQCDLCGKIAELRPYGPNGECVCFQCGMKDEAAAQRRASMHLFGVPTQGEERWA